MEVLELLAAEKANLDVKDKYGNSVWDYVMDSEDKSLLERWIQCYRQTKKLPPNKLVIPVGKTPLHIAALKDDCEMVNILLSMGAQPTAVGESGNNFLHLAAQANCTAILENFMGEVDVNAQNADGETALHLATRSNHKDSVTILLKKSHIDVPNSLGETALHVACKTKKVQPEVISLIVDTIVKAHNWDLVDRTDNHGNTGLHIAARVGRSDAIEHLTHLNPRKKNNEGNTPLHITALVDALGVAENLLETFSKNLQIDSQNTKGETALHIAATQGNPIMVTLLIDNGADLKCKDKAGNTVLHALIGKYMEDAERRLLYMQVFDRIVYKAARWWCLGRDLYLPDEVESDLHLTYKRQAVQNLISNTPNKQDLSVLGLAAKIGAKEILRNILHIPQVYMTLTQTDYVFDVTQLTHDTMQHNKKEKDKLVGDNMQYEMDFAIINRQSTLDLILQSKNIQIANGMLDLAPLEQLVQDYWLAYQWIYGVLMVGHVVYMSLLSYYIPPLVTAPPLTAANTKRELYPYALFMIWPLMLLLFEVYSLFASVNHCLNGGNLPGMSNLKWKGILGIPGMLMDWIMNYLNHISCLFFSCLVLVWFKMYLYDDTFQVYVLAGSLMVGWLFSIVFTDGFEALHGFSIMVKNIIVRDITKFIIFYMFILMGFSFAFQAIILLVPDMHEQFPTVWDIFFMVIDTMMGMRSIVEYDIDSSFQKANQSVLFVKILYLIYILYTTIILLNLLIAMMTDSYAEVKATEGTTWRVGSIRLAVNIEQSMPFLPAFFRVIGVKKNKINFDAESGRWLMTVPKAESALKGTIVMTEAVTLISQLDDEVKSMKYMHNTMSENIEQLLEWAAKQDRPERRNSLNSAVAPPQGLFQK